MEDIQLGDTEETQRERQKREIEWRDRGERGKEKT
jgi:hypothetical protein